MVKILCTATGKQAAFLTELQYWVAIFQFYSRFTTKLLVSWQFYISADPFDFTHIFNTEIMRVLFLQINHTVIIADIRW